MVTVATVLLVLNLASSALTALTGPTSTPIDTATGGSEASGASAYLEATLVRTDLRPSEEGGPEGGEEQARCVAARSVRTTYRPVLLLNRTEAGCGAHERVDATLYLSSRAPVEILDRWMALCHLTSYRMVQAASGPMIGAKGPATCTMLDLPPLVPGPETRHRIDGHVSESSVDGPGLQVLCSAAEVRTDEGEHRLVGDMTWFEAWELEGQGRHREGHLQSQAPDIPCERLGLELPTGWPEDLAGER